jgi:hypothetical protein
MRGQTLLDEIEVYDIPIKWNAAFSVKNILFESAMKFGTIVATPSRDGTVFLVEFTTDTPDRRVAQDMAFKFLDGLKAILELEIGKPCLIELVDLKIINSDDIRGHSSFKVLTGESYYRRMLLESVRLSKDRLEHIGRIYGWLYPHELRVVGVYEYDLQYSLLTMLHWYRKAIEESTIGDQLVALWISFNAAYAFVWRRDHEKPGTEMMMVKNLIVESNLLKSDECKEIIQRHDYMVRKALPELREKDYLVQQFGKDWKKYCNNPYGFDFWRHQEASRWAEALCEIIAFIYGVRNSLFHGRWLPKDSELMAEYVSALHDLVSLTLHRLAESSIAPANSQA